jgi:hypothetical protein
MAGGAVLKLGSFGNFGFLGKPGRDRQRLGGGVTVFRARPTKNEDDCFFIFIPILTASI